MAACEPSGRAGSAPAEGAPPHGCRPGTILPDPGHTPGHDEGMGSPPGTSRGPPPNMAANAHVTLPEQQPMGEHAIQQPSSEQFAELSQSIGLADQQLFAEPHASQQQQATLQELAHLQERIRQDREQLALERAQMHAMTQQSSQPYHSFASTPWEQQQPPSSASYYTLGGRPVHQDSFCTSSTSPPPHCSLHSTYSTNTWDGSRPTLVSERQ